MKKRKTLRKLKFSLFNKYQSKINILSILIIFFLLQIKNVYAIQEKGCTKINFQKGNKYSIKEFKVEIDKNKQWTKNGIRILIDNSRIIPEKYKKRYNGSVIIKLENDLICKFRSRIRQNGDLKDHISIHKNSIKQSLDVHLKERNIQGITKFKLFLDGTRGNSDDEIILSEILREFNFISPRTFNVMAIVNGVESRMLFQEKTEKEMLEYNKKVESAIFEGNEKLLVKSLEKFANNNLSNDQIGMLGDIEKSVRVLLGRQTNINWSEKSPIHSKISLNALSNLNKGYIQFQNSFKNEFNNYVYYNYNFDNKNLGQNVENIVINLDIYNLILTATNAWHGLSANNRKFYWNNIGNYFEPIYYDGNVDIFLNDNINLSLPYSNYISQSIILLEGLLDEVDTNEFRKKLSNRGLDYTNEQVKSKIDIIRYNLLKIKESIKNYDQEIIELNKEIKFNKQMLEAYFFQRKKIDSETNFIFKEKDKKYNPVNFLNCTNLSNCNEIKINFDQQNKLLSGEFFNGNSENVYLGFYSDLTLKSDYKSHQFDGNNFYYSDGIDFKINEKEKKIDIYQKKPEARAYFIKSKLKDFSINFIGYEKFDDLKFLPFDLKGLTGCLTIVDSDVENINLSSKNSNCEDSINFINVKGKVNKIDISNAYRDALDLDFSTVKVNNIKINKAGNDCLDVSFGVYEIDKINLSECKDKGISIGEKSIFKSNNTNIYYSETGVASKDSSIANFDRIYLDKSKTCFAAYNKKQEFNGGIIKSNFFQCKNYENKLTKDSYSKIMIENNVF